MARLAFAASELLAVVEEEPVELIKPILRLGLDWRGDTSKVKPGRAISTVSVIDLDPLEPVRDLDGQPIWRIRVGSEEEMTCLVCGETNTTGRCTRCGAGYDDAVTPMVPTLSYLREGEYELIKRTW